MKIFVIIFLIFVVGNKGTNSISSNTELKTIALNLLNKVMNAVQHLDKIELEIVTLREQLDQLKTKIDFGIPKNVQVIKIEEIIKKHQLNRGIDACIKRKDNKTIALIGELRTILIQKVNTQLTKYKVTLTEIHKTLQNIFNSIQGKYLDMEMKFCANNPEHCRLTIQYSDEVNNAEEIMNTISNVTQTLIDLVLQAVVYPIVSNKIYSEIYKPVIECIIYVQENIDPL